MLIKHQSLSSILFPGYRRRVLGPLLLHPDESLHGREIARRTNLTPGTLTRELISKLGHHPTAIQTLPTTFGIDAQTVVRLDKLRKQRNLTEYSGDIIPESAVSECPSQAESLCTVARDWLNMNRPDLL